MKFNDFDIDVPYSLVQLGFCDESYHNDDGALSVLYLHYSTQLWVWTLADRSGYSVELIYRNPECPEDIIFQCDLAFFTMEGDLEIFLKAIISEGSATHVNDAMANQLKKMVQS